MRELVHLSTSQVRHKKTLLLLIRYYCLLLTGYVTVCFPVSGIYLNFTMNRFLLILSCCILLSCKQTPMNKTHVIRLKPGEDLKISVTDYVRRQNIKAGWIVTCAGSL